MWQIHEQKFPIKVYPATPKTSILNLTQTTKPNIGCICIGKPCSKVSSGSPVFGRGNDFENYDPSIWPWIFHSYFLN